MSENKQTAIMKYGEYTPEAAEQDAADAKKRSRAKVPWLKIPEGTTSLRILPPLLGRSSPFVRVDIHRLDVDAVTQILELRDEEADAYAEARAEFPYPLMFNCLRDGKKKCAACDWAWELRNAAKDNPMLKADGEAGYQASAKTNVFACVIVRGEESKGPQVWRMSRTLYGQLADMRANPKIGNFTDPGEKGFDLIVTRVGTGPKDTRYSVTPARVSEPLSEDAVQANAWIEAQYDLSALSETTPLRDLVDRILNFSSVSEAPAAKAHRGPTAQDDIEDAEIVG